MVHGFPEVYKPSGRLSFHGDSVELVGEGALKKAYDELKLKLEREGLFAAERKRAILEYPEKIGLITSKTGAVIHDFLNNIGKFGYHIQFIDSRVEGQLAVADLLSAVRSFCKKDIDVLVLIRGGGSLESLLAFNNEMLVREISRFPKPVICGIGHDKDVPLVALAADMAVSTPTAVTRILNSSWEQATALVRLAEREIFGAYREALLRAWRDLELSSQKTRDGFLRILGQLRIMEQSVRNGMARIGYEVEKKARQMQEWSTALPKYLSFALLNTREYLLQSEKAILAYNHKRQLKLGYSIARMKGKIIRSVSDVRVHDLLDLTVTDGIIGAKVLLRNKATEDK
jgi:exodeoxyribonuclease VII large subunit